MERGHDTKGTECSLDKQPWWCRLREREDLETIPAKPDLCDQDGKHPRGNVHQDMTKSYLVFPPLGPQQEIERAAANQRLPPSCLDCGSRLFPSPYLLASFYLVHPVHHFQTDLHITFHPVSTGSDTFSGFFVRCIK